MKAYVLHGVNDLKLEEVEKSIPKSGEVLVKVMAAGICGSDIPRAFTTGAHKHPLIIGHEFSGLVVECGKETDEEWKNKRVGIFPLIPCKQCEPCRNKQYEMCRNYNYLGSRCDGGFAEYVAVPEWNLIELPENVSYEQAAMLEPMSVAVHAMRKVMADNNVIKKVNDNSISVAVCGFGTIGLLLTMFLKNEGIEDVYVFGNKEFQHRMANELGVNDEHYCDINVHNASEWLSSHTNGKGVDIFFECVGKNETILLAVDNMAPSGKIVLVGNPYSDINFDKNTYWKILRNQLTISGTWNSSFTKQEDDDWRYVLGALEKGLVHPEKIITHELELDDLMEGFEIMKDKKEEYGKVMCIINRK